MTAATDKSTSGEESLAALGDKVREPFLSELVRLQINPELADDLEDVYIPLALTLSQARRENAGPLVVGINGGQGAGKSTLSALLQVVLQKGFALRTTGFSIDDLYLKRTERQALAHRVHPLLATRGVPGTHDPVMGCRLIEQLTTLQSGQTLALPSFDKARDDRRPPEEWPLVSGPFDVVLFEGWCVGATPEPVINLQNPLNKLETFEDKNGAWRRYVNQQLEQSYAALFAKIDQLIMLKVPDMESVYRWRSLQEAKLAAQAGPDNQERIMDAEELKRFIMHYERLTRHMLREMPKRADIVLCLDNNHRITAVRGALHLNRKI